MRCAFLLLLAALMLPMSPLSAQSTRTLVKSFSMQGKSTVLLTFNGPVEVKTWANETVRVQMAVMLEGGNENSLNALVQSGRYNLISSVTDEALKVFCPGMARQTKFNGANIKEIVTYTVFVPEGVNVLLQPDGTSLTAN